MDRTKEFNELVNNVLFYMYFDLDITGQCIYKSQQISKIKNSGTFSAFVKSSLVVQPFRDQKLGAYRNSSTICGA